MIWLRETLAAAIIAMVGASTLFANEPFIIHVAPAFAPNGSSRLTGQVSPSWASYVQNAQYAFNSRYNAMVAGLAANTTVVMSTLTLGDESYKWTFNDGADHDEANIIFRSGKLVGIIYADDIDTTSEASDDADDWAAAQIALADADVAGPTEEDTSTDSSTIFGINMTDLMSMMMMIMMFSMMGTMVKQVGEQAR